MVYRLFLLVLLLLEQQGDKEATGCALPHVKEAQEDKMESSHYRDKDLKRKEMSLQGIMLSQRENMWAVLAQKGIPPSLDTSGQIRSSLFSC